jgi:hypothetical protein
MNLSGFYCLDNQDLLYADTMLQFSNGMVLRIEEADQHTYPVQGWTWYQDEASARSALGLPPPEPDQI